MEIRTLDYRAGFRAIGNRCSSLRAALKRLARDGHLGQRKCAVTDHFAPLVVKAGSRARKALTFDGRPVPASRIWPHLDSPISELQAPSPEHAWLEVPAGMESEAAEICAELLR